MRYRFGPLARGIGVAIAAVLCALAAQWLLNGFTGGVAPLSTFYLAVTLASLAGGRIAGFTSILLSVLLATFFLLDPIHSLNLPRADDLVRLGLFTANGTIIALVAGSYQTALQRAKILEEETGKTARLLQAVGNASPDLIYAKDREFRTIYANAATLRALGLPPDHVFGRAASEYATVEEEGHQHAENDAHVLTSGEVRICDEVFTGPDRIRRVFRSSKAPLRDERGAIVGIAGVSVDVTERRALEDDLREKEHHLRLLVAELNHRVKNTLSVVQSIAHQSLSKADRSPEVAAFEGRLRALADAHNLLTSKNWESATMQEVVAQALKPFTAEHRFTLVGPHASLDPQPAVNLTLALHELATNASKYGSLSNEAGSVLVKWGVDEDGQLQLRWEERGGPPVQEPRKQGFGTRMIQRVLSAELGGTTELSFRPSGLVCTVTAPL